MGKAYLQSRVLDKAQKIHLSNNKGISIMCEPSSGHLHKKQQQKIMITMFNNTSGKFRDSLVINVKDMNLKSYQLICKSRELQYRYLEIKWGLILIMKLLQWIQAHFSSEME